MKNKILLSEKKRPSKPMLTRLSSIFGMSFMLILLALFSTQCKDDDFTGEVVGVCPEVILTSPLNGAINVVTSKAVNATFNEKMDPATINETTFILRKGGNLVSGAVSYNGVMATFIPTNLLTANTVYTATILREATDLMGSIMRKDTTWSFNTGAIPVVVLTDPTQGTSDVVLNKIITADFSTTMNASTINASSFIVKQGANVIAGTVSYAGLKATFIPTANLLTNKVYTATITKYAADLAGNTLARDTTWSFATGVLPMITLTDPLNAAINVSVNRKVNVTFSKVMSMATINPSTFTVKQGTNLVSGLISYQDMTATFTPTANLLPGTEYTATVTTGVKDLANNTIAKDSTWKFTTSVLIIPIMPYVVSTDPSNLDVDVAFDKVITATFSKAMDATTINSSTFTLMNGTTAVLGYITYTGLVGTFKPATPLLSGTVYKATVTIGAKDVDGNAMAGNKTWSFTTVSPIVLPIVVSTDPNNLDIDVALDKSITATFSKTMNPTTINSSTFILMNGLIPVLGAVTYVGVKATFNPSAVLMPATVYTAIITNSVKDVDGNAMATNKTWSFTSIVPTGQYSVTLNSFPVDAGNTSGGGQFNSGVQVTVNATPKAGFTFTEWTEAGLQVSTLANYSFTINKNRNLMANFAVVNSGPLGIDLGAVGRFAIIAGAGISNTGVSTIITGDVGSFPTATINGLLSGNVNGILYTTADPLVGAAKNALTAAYNDAQGRSLNAISLPGQLGGLTLAPGLYVNSSTSGISGTGPQGILTLDAGGNPNAVWIFKMGSTLITDAGTKIVIAGNAQAKNIYWSVGTSATLGTNSIFFGNILADQSITLTTGASLTGRALTRIAAVSLDSNTVTKPE